jgi:hypothetical protein
MGKGWMGQFVRNMAAWIALWLAVAVVVSVVIHATS